MCARPTLATRSPDVLKVDNIETSYGASQALFGIDLEVGEREVVTLLGRNGMGKTTTVNSIMGLVPPQVGTITFRGQIISGLPPFRAARMGIGLVPEGRQVFPNLSVAENLVAAASNRMENQDPWTLERIYHMFPEIARRSKLMATQLSGGEQQMLAIGRALMTNPKLLILDEATEGLAPLVRADIWACLAGLKAAGQSILVIDKNVKALTKIADRHYIIEKGKVVWHGTSPQLAADEELQHRYLGV
ncbi:MAG TPA: ABC transporter ATP-binding protein [Rhodospirillales bacterium]|nr:ABC transporter ATP-binding protein [Rhodospirillales bacterium]